MDAFLEETDDNKRMPSFGKVAIVPSPVMKMAPITAMPSYSRR